VQNWHLSYPSNRENTAFVYTAQNMLRWIFMACLGGFTIIPDIEAQVKPIRNVQVLSGISHHRLIENRLSPLLYSSAGFTGAAIWNKRSAKGVQQFQYAHQFANTRNAISSSLTGTSIAYEAQQIQYAWQKVICTKQYILSVGPQMSMTRLYRRHTGMYNNAAVEEFRGGIDLKMQLLYPFLAGNRNWQMHSTVEIPLAGLQLRPAWGSWRPQGIELFEEANALDNLQALKASTVNRYMRVLLSWQLDYILKNGNLLGAGMYQIYTRTSDRFSEPFVHAEYGFYLSAAFAF
jgi:hypothetical protein